MIASDDLRIEYGGGRSEAAQAVADLWKAAGEIVIVARVDADFIPLLVKLSSEAVKFDLVNPNVPFMG